MMSLSWTKEQLLRYWHCWYLRRAFRGPKSMDSWTIFWIGFGRFRTRLAIVKPGESGQAVGVPRSETVRRHPPLPVATEAAGKVHAGLPPGTHYVLHGEQHRVGNTH